MIHTTDSLLARGLSHSQIRVRLRAGQLHRVARGRYSDLDPSRLTPEEQHLQLVLALWPGMASGSVVCHATAGVLHGLWLPADQLGRVHVTRPGTHRSLGRRVRIHAYPDPVAPQTVPQPDIEALVVTDLLSTTVSLVSSLPLPAAVAVADSALRSGLDRRRALDLVERWPPRPGRRRARLALDFADALSESAGESRSRWLMHEAGLPAPILQQNFVNEHGEWIARGDFWWPAYRVVGEFDGRIKYGRLLGPGQRLEDVIAAERDRERALQNLGYWVTRWGWTDLDAPVELMQRLSQTLARRSR